MRIAVSGTHFIGKSTLIDDFINRHPEYHSEKEPYEYLEESDTGGLTLDPSFESFLEQLDYSIQQVNSCKKMPNVIFDRCPLDFLAYLLYELNKESIDINDTEVSERFSEIKETLNTLDLIIFLPINKENHIEYSEDDPIFRKAVDIYLKRILRDDLLEVFPRYDHPRIIELSGSRKERLQGLEAWLKG